MRCRVIPIPRNNDRFRMGKSSLKSTRSNRSLFFRIGMILINLVAVACQSKAPPPPPKVFPVTVSKAVEKSVPVFVEGLGHVESVASVQIRSRIEGELTGVYFQQGQEVKAGDLLFTIDPKPYEAALKEAQGTLEQSLANLAIAEEKVKRYKTLAHDEYYSQIDYETLQANLAATQGVVAQNRGSVDSAAINLDYCWIYAPVDGMVGILEVDQGNLVRADGRTLVTLNQMAPIYATFTIPENQLQHVQKAQRESEKPLSVLAAFDDFKKEHRSGSLFMIDNQVEQATGMVRIRAIFENQDRDLWPGQFIRTRVILSSIENATVIPFSAIQMTLHGPIVYVVTQDQKVAERQVKVGPRQDDEVVILEGVKGGEVVVTDGQLNLFNGALISIKGGA